MTKEELQTVKNYILNYRAHDDLCNALELDEEGKHMACSCGLTSSLAILDAALAQKEQEPVAWIPFTDSIYRDETAYKILLPWLEGHTTENCASMTVVFNKFDGIWASVFWHGNRGYEIGRFREIEDAKQSCINRLSEMRSALYAAPVAQPNQMLVEALKAMVENFEFGDMNDGEYAAIQKARAALAAVEGK